MKKYLLYLFCFVSILLQPQYLYGQDKLTKKGYKITWLDNLKKYYLVLKPFEECDSLYYLSYYENSKNYGFYFMLVDETLKDYIISNTVNLSRQDKRRWAKQFLQDTRIKQISRVRCYNEYWTRFKQSYSNDPIVQWGRILSGNKLSLYDAISTYNYLRSRKVSASDLTVNDVMLLAVGVKMLSGSSGGKFHCSTCSYSSNDAADVRSHENHVHGY
jgi:hypothetical protein